MEEYINSIRKKYNVYSDEHYIECTSCKYTFWGNGLQLKCHRCGTRYGLLKFMFVTKSPRCRTDGGWYETTRLIFKSCDNEEYRYLVNLNFRENYAFRGRNT